MAAASIPASASTQPGKDFSRLQWGALLIVVCSAFSSQMVMPLWVGAVIDDLNLSAAAAGRIGSFEFMAVAVVSLLVAFKIQCFPTLLTVTAGLALLIFGNFGSAFATNETQLIATRMLCGLGKGFVVAIAFSLAAGSSRPTRAFAVLNIVYALFQTAFYLMIPFAIRWEGASGAFIAMGVVSVIGALCVFRFPSERLVPGEKVATKLRDLPRFGFFAFAALILLWSGHNAIWTFVERIGVRDGLQIVEIGAVLSFSAFLTIAGPTLVRLVDTRFGFGLPLAAGIAVKLLAVLVIGFVVSPQAFTLAVPLFMLAALFITPYVMGILSLADPAGRLAAASSAAMTAGGSLGALVGGASLAAFSWPGITYAALLHFLVFIAIMIGIAPIASRFGRQVAA